MKTFKANLSLAAAAALALVAVRPVSAADAPAAGSAAPAAAEKTAPAGTAPAAPAGTAPATPAGTASAAPAGTAPAAPEGTAPAAPAGTAPAEGAADATAGVVGTVPAVPVEQGFRYDASLPDPFVPYSEPILKCPAPGEPLPPGTVVPEECGDEVKEPLELFELGEINVLGIIWGIRDARAKVKDPEGNYWTVRVGQKIGKNRGRIKAIREGEIEVEERFWDEGLRAYQKITSTMAMQKQ